MKKILIFGAGFLGEAAYYKLRQICNILYYIDNDRNKTGKKLHNITIINMQKLKQVYDEQYMDIVIASQYFSEMEKQLCDIGIKKYYVIKNGFFYYKDSKGEVIPHDIGQMKICTDINEKRSILFVQNTACIRTHKIARALKCHGWKVFLAYTTISPELSNGEYVSVYDSIYAINTIPQFIEWINKSDFNYIHSSNEPDFLTVILTQTKKIIIHDCHDLSSAYKSMTPKEMFLEFAANRNSRGVIYTTEGIRDKALEKFNIPREKTFVLANLISEELAPQKRLKKISTIDNELHCVYEGGVIPKDKESHRYFEVIWKKLAECGLHIHFYTNCEKQYCIYLDSLHERIHYEGNLSSKQLAEEMTKYDVGLCVLNVTLKNKQYVEFASPNKIQEYVNAGLPVAVGDVSSQKKFVEENGFGKQIDFYRDILAQFQDIAKIKIEDNILHKKGLTFESKIPELIKFYDKCKYSK